MSLSKNIAKSNIVFLLIILTGVFCFPYSGRAAIELVKSQTSPTIYYLDGQNVRHTFPNEITYRSWYGQDFSKIVTVSDELLAGYPVGKNITIRPGKYLVKIPSDPKVYAVEQGGRLRPLDSPDIAAEIYGISWQKKIIDIPEVFFDNYTIGKPIEHDYDIPDNAVYRLGGEGIYYYKAHNILRAFDSTQSVLDNGYLPGEAIIGTRQFYARSRPISGLDKNVFNPVAKLTGDTSDCANTELKAAFIFINQKDYTAQEVQNLEKIKQALPAKFDWATQSLAKIDINWPTVVMLRDKYLVRTENQVVKLTNEVPLTFYNDNPDIFDFLIAFTDFDIESDGKIATLTPVTNRVTGIGKQIMYASEIYGGYGKLKGFINMGNVNQYNLEKSNGMDEVQNYILHEILHQWSGSLLFTDAAGQLSSDLLKVTDNNHWSYYASWVSPLGGSGWQDNGNGTFTSQVSQMLNSSLKRYAPIDLYAMGLLPAQVIQPLVYIVPEEPNAFGNVIRGKAKTVTIDQVISANGKWGCNANNFK